MKLYQSRDEVPVEEQWNLADIYPDQKAWEEDFRKVLEITEKTKSFDGKITSGKILLEYLTESEELSYLYKKVYVYAMLQVDLDTRVTAAQSLLDRASQLGQKISKANSFFMPFLLSLDEETLKSYIKDTVGLSYFEDDLFDSFRYKDHVLSKEQEEILSQMGEALSAPQKTFGMLNNADIQFGTITNDEGDQVELTRGMYAKLSKSPDRNKRKEAYEAYYKPYLQMKNTIASTLSAAVNNNVMLSKLKSYPSALEKALFGDNVPLEVYENLIKSTEANIGAMHQYIKLRKEVLGLEDLRPYDLSVPLVDDIEDEIPYEEAYDTMLKSLEPLGEEYISILKSFKEKRYLDVRETPGKRSGAYNLGLYGVHPFILLNHRNDLDSLFTLAHECGHAMHSYYSSKYQPQISSGYSIFVAEVASTVNEILLIRYLLNTTEDVQKKRYLLNHFIDGFKGTFFTQVLFSEFEKTVHEKAENDEPLNAEVFKDVYERIYKKHNGEELIVDDKVIYGWARIPHFYRPFYVYKYATGYASAISIADRILAGDKETLSQYINFLKSGSSEFPLDLLKSVGVDLTKPEPIQSALNIFRDLVDEFAALQP